MYKPVTHVLFDMDGLILNTEVLYTVAYQNVLAPFGKKYTFDVKVQLMGMQSDECADKIIKLVDLPLTRDEFKHQLELQMKVLFPDNTIMPGAEKLIKHLSKHNIPLGLATSSSLDSYHLKVDKHHKQLFEHFTYKTMGSSDPEVKRGKPYPDIFLITAAKFPDKPNPEQCLVFEDSLNGVRAAKAAGMQVVMVPDPQVDKNLADEATLVLKSLEDFKPELFGLPPFDD